MLLYTRRQLLIVLALVLAAGVGLSVGHWRRAHPDLVERLERLDRRPTPAPPAARSARPREAPARRADERAAPRSDARPRRPGARAHAAARAEARSVDPNLASAGELVGLPGVGPVLAARIVAAREERGPFETIDDLRRVRGLGRRRIERLRPLLRIAE